MRFALAAIAGLVLALGASPAAADTTINLTDKTWVCNHPLSAYGELPIVVNQTWTHTNAVEFGVRILGGCVGDGDPQTVDLILSSDADGVNGPYGDAVRIANDDDMGDLVITGEAKCGRGRAGNHQDGVQAIGGHDITFRDFSIGPAASGFPSCQGAGGAMFYSNAQNWPVNMRVEGGTYYGCNVALRAGSGAEQSGHVENATFRNGYDSSHPTACRDSAGHAYAKGPTCIFDTHVPPQITHENNTCEKWPHWSTHHPPPPPAPPPPPCIGVCRP